MMIKVGNSGSKYDYPIASIDNDVKERNSTINSFESQLKDIVMSDIRYFDNMPMSQEQRLQSLLNVAKWYKEMI